MRHSWDVGWQVRRLRDARNSAASGKEGGRRERHYLLGTPYGDTTNLKAPERDLPKRANEMNRICQIYDRKKKKKERIKAHTTRTLSPGLTPLHHQPLHHFVCCSRLLTHPHYTSHKHLFALHLHIYSIQVAIGSSAALTLLPFLYQPWSRLHLICQSRLSLPPP